MKYSIIIPVKNGNPYIKSAIESIITQNYNDYELIISDDHSTDGSIDIVKSIDCSQIRIFSPEKTMSMSEHWDWAASHAKGEWQMFLGQDDGLQGYFFEIADYLTNKAECNNIRTIGSKRAFYFWKGCEQYYGKYTANYQAYDRFVEKKIKREIGKAFIGLIPYFDLPTMYTSSIFNRSIIEEARERLNGKLIVAHPQDANLAVIAASLEKKYLYSEIPLGWSGSSPKSAGLAMSLNNNDVQKEIKQLKDVYAESIQKSPIHYYRFAGEFSFSNCTIYLWQAFLVTQQLDGLINRDKLRKRQFLMKMFASIYYELKRKQELYDEKKKQFIEILDLNKCRLTYVIGAYILLRPYFSIMRYFNIVKIHICNNFYKIQQKYCIIHVSGMNNETSLMDVLHMTNDAMINHVLKSFRKRYKNGK